MKDSFIQLRAIGQLRMSVGFDDFAFSGVVHGLGGAASLAGAFMTGPRKDHFHSDGKTIREIPDGSVAVE